MSVTANHLTIGSAASGTSFTTASILPSVGKLILIIVGSDIGSGPTPNVPSVSGCNMTWTLVGTGTDPGTNFRRISLFRGIATNPTTGVITLSFAGQNQGSGCCWSVEEFDHIDKGGTNGSSAIVQSASNGGNGVTSLTVTLGAFSDVDNATFGGIMKNGTEAITTGSGFTQLGQNNSPQPSIQTQWKASNDTTCEWTWGTNHIVVGFAVELKEKIYDVMGGMI